MFGSCQIGCSTGMMSSSAQFASNLSCLPPGGSGWTQGVARKEAASLGSNVSVGPSRRMEVNDLDMDVLTGKDASWILTTSVIIFTMQTGFGLLEAGCVSPKNEVNIMMKNALDVVFGGITYWAFGFGLSFGSAPGSNSIIGVGCFFVDADIHNMGYVFAVFLFQLSFATTSTTIVSGAMTERTKLSAYILFSLINTVVYSIPAHWLWAKGGFLKELGAIDVAGCAPVHLVGGATGLVATVILKPRMGAFKHKHKPPLPAPIKTILGLFMLWWGWLRFSSGSVFIMSSKSQWKLAVRAAVSTIIASISGGIAGVLVSIVINRWRSRKAKYDIGIIVNGVLGSLVSVTGMCTLCKPWEALVIGLVGVILASLVDLLLFKLRVDDPVGVVPVHGACAIWGLLCVGLFLEPKDSYIEGEGGLLKTGQWYLLGVQALTCLVVIGWTAPVSIVFLKIIDVSIGLRMRESDEEAGADATEHGIPRSAFADEFDLKYQTNDRTMDPDLARNKFITAFKEVLKLNKVDFTDDGAKLLTIKFE